MMPQDSTPLNKLELTSIYALLAYAAFERRASEQTVREIVAANFGVSDVSQLTSRSYDDVVRFLVDLQIDMILN